MAQRGIGLALLLVGSAAMAYEGRQGPVPQKVREQMTGVSWHPGCPVSFDELALLDLPHWGFDGALHHGQLVVARSVAPVLLTVFVKLFEVKFPIERMALVDAYGGDDEKSMAANNSSGFNCRRVMGERRWSLHARGLAVDINPVQNPYLKAGRVYPPAAESYLDRAEARPGMILRNDPVHAAFRSIGWKWGGLWLRGKDYQHFSTTGR